MEGEKANIKKSFNKTEEETNQIIIRLKISHKLSFIFGLILGFFVLRHQMLMESSQYIMNYIRGRAFYIQC